MTSPTAAIPTRELRCALFVDFDNVYIGLQRLDPALAEEFSGSPARWLAALQEGSDEHGEFTRRFLIRNCYLNPSVFSRFRANFTRAGFSVVDCPSLTQQGKSSADINLVLDAVDALGADTRYDEFVIASADADFTPLAIRARAADRRVTIITPSPAAIAYRSVADSVITTEMLTDLSSRTQADDLEDAAAPAEPTAGEPADPAGAETPRPPRAAAAAKARTAVLRLVRSADAPLPGGTVAQAAQQADPTLPATKWDGTGNFFAWLKESVTAVESAPRPAPGFVWDPRRFSVDDLPGAGGPDLAPLQRQVVDVTGIPNLTTEQYRLLVTTLAQDLEATPFERPGTALRVRDACHEAGEQIGRTSVNAVISGVLYSGLDLTAAPSAAKLAETWAGHVIGLCRGARMDMGPADERAVREWLGAQQTRGTEKPVSRQN